MIKQLQYLRTFNTIPYKNIAMEAYLLENVPENTCILYLWQNQNTVVIGKNQNAWKECRISELEDDHGYLARRLSGGGAVYHDLGNLNFTFLVPTADYDVKRQLEVIRRAVASFGLNAENSGRNDITVQGRKFSGNAFYHSGGNSYHHGTILVDVDMAKLSRYLNVSAPKLQSKGVDSVRARVVNLAELCAEITIESLIPRLNQAFGEVYGLEPTLIQEAALDAEKIAALTEKFQSWDWRLGRKIPFTWQVEERYAWGGIQLCLQINSGIIEDCVVYSDAMDAQIFAKIQAVLTGCIFRRAQIVEKLAPLAQENAEIITDILALLEQQSI